MAAPSFGFYQSFENGNTNGIVTDGGYGSATLAQDAGAPDGSNIAIFNDPGPNSTGPFTKFDGYRTDFVDQLETGVKVYLDTEWAVNQGFQYTVAANGSDGAHQRDFGVQVRAAGDDVIQIGISNGATQEPVTSPPADFTSVTTSGWYTIQHVFQEVDGKLSVSINLISDGTGEITELGVLSGSDLINDVGGNRYGWFTDISVDGGIKVDTITLGNFDDSILEGNNTYSETGVIPFLDSDPGDVHTVTVASNDNAGTFSATVEDNGVEGAVRWTFVAGAGEFDSLTEGQVVVQDYTLSLSDGQSTVSQTVTVRITGTNDAPVFTSGSTASTAENITPSTIVYTAVAADADNSILTYTLSGVDASQFSISSDGKITFISAPNFEAPMDANSDNVYDITVGATDGTLTDNQAVAITVTDVNETPTQPPVTPPVTQPTDGPDIVTGTDGSDSVAAGAGDDAVSAGAGDDQVFGNQGNDRLVGGAGSDTVYGGQDNDTVLGGSAEGDPSDTGDYLSGNAGNDVIYGNGGGDSIYGGEGSDTAAGGQGNDVMYGGDSNASPVDGADKLEGGVGQDTVYGNGGDDQILGNQDNDLLFGGQGNDYIHGGQGNDVLFGGFGDDIINGGVGNNQLTGGDGADAFVFGTGGGSNVVTDFNQSAGDVLDLQGQTYTYSEVDDSTILTLSGGGTITLLGVTGAEFQNSLAA